MKLPWLINKTPAEPEPTPPVEQAPEPSPTPAPEPDQEQTAAPAASWITPTRVAVAAAAVPSVLSLVWVASTVAEITGGPAGLAAGIFADVLIVSTVAVGWFNADVRRLASIGGWVASIAAGLLLGWHHWGTEEVAFALVPVGAKFLWHVALVARTSWEKRRDAAARAEADRIEAQRRQAQEAEQAEAERVRERELALSTDLTDAEERELAGLRRKAVYARAKAEAENELTTAEADADRMRQEASAEAERIRQETEHRMRQEAIRRRVEEQMAVQQANADLLKQRQALELELQLTRPYAIGGGSQERVPDDLSGLDTPPPDGSAGAVVAGFGFSPSGAPAGGARPGDQQVPRVRTEVHPSQTEAERNREAVLAAYDRLVQAGCEPTITAVADEAGVSRRTVTRRLPADKLKKA